MLKVGLLVESAHSDRYVEELVLWTRREPDIRISHLIVQPGPPVRASFFALENILLRWSKVHKDHYAVRELSGLVDHVVHIRGEQDVEKVAALELDLLISCARHKPGRALLAASRLGVIAFLHQDEGYAGFWECYRGEPQTEFLIRRLGPDSDEVLVRGAFRTHFYYSLNQAHIHKKAVGHVKQLLKKVAASGQLPAARRSARPQAGRGAPGMAQGVLYGCKVLGRVSLKALTRLPVLSERFGIWAFWGKWDQPIRWQHTGPGPSFEQADRNKDGFVDKSEAGIVPGLSANFERADRSKDGRLDPEEFAKGLETLEVRTPRGRFWADPFLYTRAGRTFCFVEDLDRRTNRGRISVLEVIGTRLIERGVALEEPFHLAFPFLFEYQGELYMCPESSAAREIRVYRCIDFPLKWRLEKTLMQGVSAADTLLFEKGGRWWLLTNIDESETGDHCSELYLFSADSPLSTNWVPHRQNPILVDSLGGRNGGLIIEGERLFRLGQCQGFDRYGESLRVYEIKEISDARYVEELHHRILGTHHLSTDGRTIVFDYAYGPLHRRGCVSSLEKPAIRLLFATIEPFPTFRPDVAALFGKFLPRLGVASDLVAERCSRASAETRWGGGEALLVSSRGARPRRYLVNVLHYVRMFVGADRHRYQAIQVRDMPLVALIGLAIARLKGLPFFYWMSFPVCEGQIMLAWSRGLSMGLVAFLFPLVWRGWIYHFLLHRIVLPRADHVFVQSDRMREDLVAQGIAREKLTPVLMGVDFECSTPERITPAVDPRLDGKRALVYLGTLARGRRIEVLFDMLRLVRAQFPEALLVLVGETEDRVQEQFLRQYAEKAGVADAVLWTGWLALDEGWSYVRAAEIGLAPYPRGKLLDSGSPTKCVEYLALGVPVIGNDNPDQERILCEGGGGICVPLTAEDFAAAACRLLGDANLRRRMAASGQAYVRASRGYDSLAKLVADKYAELLHAA